MENIVSASVFQIELNTTHDSGNETDFQVKPGNPVLYNNIIVPDNSGNIVISDTEDTFKINNPGKYLINWWITYDSGDTNTALKGHYNNSTNYIIIKSLAGTNGSNQLIGSAILDLSNDADFPFYFSIINNNSSSIIRYITQGNPVSGLSIVQVSCSSSCQCFDCSDRGEVLQLELDTASIPTPTDRIKYCDSVKFNNKLVESSNAPSYDSSTGTFTITKSGRYTINWWVATQSVLAHSALGFAIVGKYRSESEYIYMFGSTAMKTGHVSGTSILDVYPEEKNDPFDFLLVNVSGAYELSGNTGTWQPFNYNGMTDEEILIFNDNHAVLYAVYTRVKSSISIVEVGTKGCKGEKGDQGVPGEKGEQGEKGATALQNGILVKVVSDPATTPGQIVDTSQPIPFNDNSFNSDTSNLVFNPNEYTITLNKKGLYSIDWWVAVEGSNATGGLDMALIVLDSDSNEIITLESSLSMIITGFMYGQHLISVPQDNDPVKVMLVNKSLGKIQLTGYTNIRASMRIVGNY